MMKKLFFGTDITTDKKNTRIDGEDFATNRVSMAQERAIDEKVDSVQSLQKKIRLPLPLHLLYLLSGFVTLVIFVAILKSLDETSVSEIFAKMPGLIYTMLISGAVWGVLALAGALRKKRLESSRETAAALQAADFAVAQAYETLGVPASAIDVDIMVCKYHIKNGAPTPKAGRSYLFSNPEMKVFVESGALCFADVNTRYDIPLSDITGIREIKKRIALPSWNKNTLPTEARYKPYRLTMNEYGQVFIRSYCVLDIYRDGLVQYELYFPTYELPIIERLTGIKPQLLQ
jgi:hypothetical protein